MWDRTLRRIMLKERLKTCRLYRGWVVGGLGASRPQKLTTFRCLRYPIYHYFWLVFVISGAFVGPRLRFRRTDILTLVLQWIFYTRMLQMGVKKITPNSKSIISGTTGSILMMLTVLGAEYFQVFKCIYFLVFDVSFVFVLQNTIKIEKTKNQIDFI